jgi:hypothetical protein
MYLDYDQLNIKWELTLFHAIQQNVDKVKETNNNNSFADQFPSCCNHVDDSK